MVQFTDILRRDFKLKAYKLQLVQELNLLNAPMWRHFALWTLEKIQENAIFSKQILFSNEVILWIIWDEEIQELPIHQKKKKPRFDFRNKKQLSDERENQSIMLL